MYQSVSRTITAAGRIAWLTIFSVALALPASALTVRRVALSGDVAPGPGGATYLSFGSIVTNDSGLGAFTATLLQGGAVDASNDLGTWSEGGGSLALVQRQGSPAVGTASSWGVASSPPVLNDAGQVALRASVDSPSAFGIWHEGTGSLAAAAVTGNPADGAPVGQSYTGPMGIPAWNDAGQVAFQSGLAGTGVTTSNDRGVWSGGPLGPYTLAARSGDLAPGSGGDTYTGFDGALVDATGGVGFRATLSGGGEGLYSGPASSVGLVARDGSAAPGVAGGEFDGFFAPDVNGGGALAFEGFLVVGPGGVSGGDDNGVWAGSPGSVGLVAREGDVAPATGGQVFTTFDTPLIGDGGDVVFRAFTDVGLGIFLDDPSTGLEKVAAFGDTAPGTDIGFGDAFFAGFNQWTVNGAGEVAFEATLGSAAEGVTSANNVGVWWEQGGVLELVVREGMLIELGLGDMAIVESIDFFGDPAALGRSLAEGALAYGVTLTDGREALYIVTPEPGSAALLALGLVALARRRRC